MAAWSRANDPSRPLHYERLAVRRVAASFRDAPSRSRGPNDAQLDVPASDVIAPMYPAIDELAHWAKTYRGGETADHVRVLACDGQFESGSLRIMGI
jgi:hypothetical protein